MIPLYDRNPTRTFPIFTLLLIAANAAVFGFQVWVAVQSPAAAEKMVYQLGVVPAAWSGRMRLEPGALTFITCMFLHGGVMHLLGNMLYLWIFGNNVEDALGHFKFLVFYFATGIAASVAHVALNLNSPYPIIGASGAISGVLGAYFLYYPRARVVGIIIIIPILWMPQFEASAFFFLAFYIIIQIVNATMGQGMPGGGVAWYAHIGGFFAGLMLALILTRRR